MPKRNPRRSSQEWLQLITECRQSGLTDHMWCEQNKIPLSSFYNAVSKLRKESCSVPDSVCSYAAGSYTLDLTSSQDVVRVEICDSEKIPVFPASGTPQPVLSASSDAAYLDNSHTIELNIGASILRISNSADIQLLTSLIQILRRSPC